MVTVAALTGTVIWLCSGVVAKPIHQATFEGNIPQIQTLLRQNPQQVNAKDAVGWTPLHWAVEYGNRAVAVLLISRGADLNTGARDGMTPLHLAAGGKQAVLELLLDRGADINAKDRDNWTPLHYAAFYGKEANVSLLIARGARVNEKNKDNKTPLDLASEKGYTKVADLLRQRGGRSGKP